MKSEDRKHPEQDPAEGSRKVIDRELKRQDRSDGKPANDAGKAADAVEKDPGRD